MKHLFPMLCLPCALVAAPTPEQKPASETTSTPTITFSVPWGDRDYLWSMIACDEKEERFVDEIYDAFLVAADKKELPKECFRVPLHFATLSGDCYIFERGFYLTQNFLRGFILSVPKDCVAVKDGMITPAYALTVASWGRKQGQEIVVLKRKAPSPPPATVLKKQG